jgi:hypothetical protein
VKESRERTGKVGNSGRPQRRATWLFPETHERLKGVRDQLWNASGRCPTYDEVANFLVDHYEVTMSEDTYSPPPPKPKKPAIDLKKSMVAVLA